MGWYHNDFFFYKNSVISSKDNMNACPIHPYRRHAVASLRSFPPFQPLFQLSDIMLHKFWENDFAAPWVQGSYYKRHVGFCYSRLHRFPLFVLRFSHGMLMRFQKTCEDLIQGVGKVK